MLSGDDDLVMRPDAMDGHQDGFDLGREDIDAADDHHIVGAAADQVHAHIGPAAGAALIVETRDVLGPVTQHRDAFLGQGRQDKLPFFSLRQCLTRHGIDDFREEMVLIDVHAFKGQAFIGNTGAGDFGQAIILGVRDAQAHFNQAAHFRRMAFAAEKADAQFQVLRCDSLFSHDLGQMQGIGRRGDQDGRAQVLHEHQLALGIAARMRDHGGAQVFEAIVETKTAGEHAITEGDLADVVRCDPGCRGQSGTAIRPDCHVIAGVADDDRLACRAGRRMISHNRPRILGKHPRRVIVTQIVLDRERDPLKILQCLDV